MSIARFGLGRVTLFGAFALTTPDGAEVTLTSRRGRGLVAFLLLAPNGMATRERLCGLLWSDRAETQARASLRQLLLELRAGPLSGELDILDVGRERVALRAGRIACDLEDLLTALRAADAATAAAMLETIGRRPLLEDLDVGGLFADWLEETRTSQDRRIAAGVHGCLRRFAQEAEWTSLLRLADAYARRDPLDEAGAEAAIRAEVATGSMAGARRRFEALREALRREVGVEPAQAVTAALSEALQGATAPRPLPPAPVAELPDKPSVAVLPFAHLTTDPEQEHFTDGMVREITSALSRFKSLFVIASGSSLSLKGADIGLIEAGRRLGVRYLLDGSVRKAGGRVRILVQLIDASNAAQIWSERFEDTLEDVFALQDRVAFKVASSLEPTIRQADYNRVARRPATSLGSYELVLRAHQLSRTFAAEDLAASLELLGRALELDPAYGEALALAGWCHVRMFQIGEDFDASEHFRLATEFTHRALRIAGDDAEVLSLVADCLPFIGQPLAEAMRLTDQAVALNPGHAYAWFIGGMLRVTLGDPYEGASRIETSMQLDPLSPNRAHQMGWLGGALLMQRRFDDACEKLRQSILLQPTFPVSHALLAACYGHLGMIADVAEEIRIYDSLGRPGVERFARYFLRDADRRLFLQGVGPALADGGEALNWSPG